MPDKPNLLFIFTDEQRSDTLGCYGNDMVRTPNLDALAKESVVFENAYVTQTVCTPSRSTIMTGLYPHTNGCTENNIPLKPDTRTIAEMVSDDYSCAYYGKWHLGDEIIAQHGFEKWVSIEDGMYRRYYSNPEYLSRFSDYHHFLIKNGFTPDIDSDGVKLFGRTMAANLEEPFTKAAFLGREAARFITENRERPFVLYVNFLEPHMPFTGPLNDLYDPEHLPTGPHFLQKPPENASMRHRLLADYYESRNVLGSDLATEAGWRRIRANYCGLVTMVDNAVGTIMRVLSESGVSDNTIVVYTSDHGDMMGDHGILAKCVQYEEAQKVPLIMRVPWFGKKERRAKGRISQIDLVPTLLELMKQPVPDYLEGTGRADVLSGKATLDDNDVFVEWNGRDGLSGRTSRQLPEDEFKRIAAQPWRTVVSHEGWKLNLSSGDRCELHDLNTDPYEQKNLFDDPAQKERIRDLTRRIQAWQKRTGDDVVLPEV